MCGKDAKEGKNISIGVVDHPRMCGKDFFRSI